MIRLKTIGAVAAGVAAFALCSGAALAHGSALHRQDVTKLARNFDAADTNHDGTLNCDEACAYLGLTPRKGEGSYAKHGLDKATHGFRRIHLLQLLTHWSEADRDGSRHLTEREILEFFHPQGYHHKHGYSGKHHGHSHARKHVSTWKKAGKASYAKACCAKRGSKSCSGKSKFCAKARKSACKAGCTKPCCAKKSACKAGCTKPCCAKKSACKAACTKPCCAKKSACKAGCTKPCCAKTHHHRGIFDFCGDATRTSSQWTLSDGCLAAKHHH